MSRLHSYATLALSTVVFGLVLVFSVAGRQPAGISYATPGERERHGALHLPH